MAPARRGRRGDAGRRPDGVRRDRAAEDHHLNHVDVAVAGGGPAGCATAIALARQGASVVVVERSTYTEPRIGETLPPEVRLLLDRLAVWDRFQADGHLPSPGLLAAWGRAEPYADDFVANPYGCGWRVDRNRFDAMLADAAREAGAFVVTGTRFERGGAGFVVDATGRASPLRRNLGARLVVTDRLVGVVGLLAAETEDRRALVEATEHGWWYSALLSDGRLLLSFQTDAAPGLRAAWSDRLAEAPETAARAGGRLPGTLRVVPAGSQRAEPAAGDGWLAVGDAAAAHDPLTGLGISWALESGLAAAGAILDGSTAAYAEATCARYADYLAARTAYYRSEARWPESPFWARRRSVTTG